jgi:subtilisin family serine protease
MRIPVLAVLAPQESLRASATAAFSKRPSLLSLEKAMMPSRLTIDARFPAVPIGDPALGMTVMKPETAEAFAVRATIEVESPKDIPDRINGARIYADPHIEPFHYCASGAQGTVANVRTKLDVAKLQAKNLDGTNVALAIVDTGVNLPFLKNALGATPRFDAANSWTPAGATSTPGSFPVDHGTMCAFDALLAAPQATLLDYPVLAAKAPGGNITGRTISVALQAYSHLLSNYAVAYAPGGVHKYAGLVVSNSWGIYHSSWDFPAGHPGRFSDNPRHPFAVVVAALTAAGADVVFAAGNCGANCPDGRCQGVTSGVIMGSSAYAEVMTVAACLVTNDDRLGYSSQGPSITGMPQQKPDVTAYAHFVGSQAFGPGTPDSGTSTACPVVAGCVAALRARLSPAACPPANLIRQFQSTARPGPGTAAGWNGDYGHGIIQPLDVANSLGL